MIEPQAFQLDKRRVRRAFEKAAPSYDGVAVLQREVGGRMLERLGLIRLEPATILDVGSGTGQMTRALLRRYRGSRVIALDVALTMLRMATGRGIWLRRPQPVCADAECLPLADASVEMICSNLALHWCNDLDRVLGELHRVLASGGVMLMTTLGPDTLRELRASWAESDRHVHVNGFIDMHDIGDAMVRAGFSDPVLDMEMMRLTYPDMSKLMHELKLLGAHNSTYGRLRGLTGKGRLQRAQQAYERFRTAEGVLPASFEVIYGHAWAEPNRQSTAGTAITRREVSVPLIRNRRTSR
jgi:malonyl-CoA O-methyltransferase